MPLRLEHGGNQQFHTCWWSGKIIGFGVFSSVNWLARKANSPAMSLISYSEEREFGLPFHKGLRMLLYSEIQKFVTQIFGGVKADFGRR
jgi:hypothetical protein